MMKVIIMIVPVILPGGSLEAETLDVEAALTLVTDQDTLSDVLPSALGAAALLALPPLMVLTHLALGGVVPLQNLLGHGHLLGVEWES